MPAFSWPTDPGPPIVDFERRHAHPDAGALLQWAVLCVEALSYLDDVDVAFDKTQSVPGHRTQVVEVAHARWATGTSITALDLGAAALGRALGGHSGTNELDLGDLAASAKKRAGRAGRAKMPGLATQWIDGVLNDPSYAVLKGARDALTHSRLTQHLTLGIGQPSKRLELQINATTRVNVRQLVIDARNLATNQITGLVNLLPSL